jgi:hypothetical protein
VRRVKKNIDRRAIDPAYPAIAPDASNPISISATPRPITIRDPTILVMEKKGKGFFYLKAAIKSGQKSAYKQEKGQTDNGPKGVGIKDFFELRGQDSQQKEIGSPD